MNKLNEVNRSHAPRVSEANKHLFSGKDLQIESDIADEIASSIAPRMAKT